MVKMATTGKPQQPCWFFNKAYNFQSTES